MLYNDGFGFSGYGSSADPTPVTATSFILELQQGERVQVYNHDTSTIIYGAHSDPSGGLVYRSWFSGFLLYAL